MIDETSFDFRGLPDAIIEGHLDALNEAISALRADDLVPASAPMWESVEILDGCELYQFLSREWPSGVDRDTLLLANSLLAKCPEWEDASGEVELDVSVGKDSPPRTALSVAYALAQQAAKWDVACLTFPSSHLRDRVKVSGKCAAGEVFFFADPSLLKKFWRAVFSFERVAEAEFYEVCRRAFPDLIFHRDLSFGRFEGTYANLRDQVVNALTALNDEFLRAYRTGNGVSREIQATMGAQGVEVSPESPNTRGSERLMRLRDVTHDGRVYRCEWHAKLEPNRNRIHFWVPSVNEGDKLIIGKFVVHLAT